MPDVRIVASDFGFPEGPVVMPDGAVILTEIAGTLLTRIGAGRRALTVGSAGGGPNGLAIGPDGALYCCNNGGGKYPPGHWMAVGPARRLRRRLHPADRSEDRRHPRALHAVGGHKLSAPNDLVFDTQGGFYFTDLGKRYARTRDHGGLYYALPDGSKIVEVAYPILSPNGCGLSPDGKVLYVADTEAGAAVGVRHRRTRRGEEARAGRRRMAAAGRRPAAASSASTAWRSRPAAISPSPRCTPAASPSSRRTGRWCARSRCRTNSRPTSASAAPTCAPPMSRCRPPADSARSVGGAGAAAELRLRQPRANRAVVVRCGGLFHGGSA